MFLGTAFHRCANGHVWSFSLCVSSSQRMFTCLNMSSRLSDRCVTLPLVPPCCEEQSCSGDVMLLQLIIQYHKNPVSKGNRRHVVEVMHFSLQIERGGDSPQQSVQCFTWALSVEQSAPCWLHLSDAGDVLIWKIRRPLNVKNSIMDCYK